MQSHQWFSWYISGLFLGLGWYHLGDEVVLCGLKPRMRSVNGIDDDDDDEDDENFKCQSI